MQSGRGGIARLKRHYPSWGRSKKGLYRGLFDPEAELDPKKADTIASMTIQLVLHWDRWVHRRVEHVAFCDEDALRRDVSIDFTLPRWFHIARGTALAQPRRQLVPLGFRRKGPLVDFSLRDEANAALPLLNSSQSAKVAVAILQRLAEAALGKDVPAPIVEDLEKLVYKKPEKCPLLFEQFFSAATYTAEREALKDNPDFYDMAGRFWENFLALAMVDIHLAERRVLYYRYEELHTPNDDETSFARQVRGEPRIEIVRANSADEAASYHIEVEAPQGLMITDAAAIDYVMDESGKDNFDTKVPSATTLSRVHFHFAYLSYGSRIMLAVSLLPRPSSGIRAATFTALLAAITTFVITLNYADISGGGEGSTAATVLLAATGVVSFIVVRSGEEPKATALLFPFRVLAASPVVLAVCAALVVIANPCDPLGSTLLRVITALMFASTGLLMWNWGAIRQELRKAEEKNTPNDN